MSAAVAAAAAAAVFGFGAAVFYVLSCIERPVLGVVRRNPGAPIAEDDIRHVHRTLQRLAPLLPPSNGVVLLGGTVLLVVAGATGGWGWPAVAALAVYWLTNVYIIAVRGIVADVRALRTTPAEADLTVVREVVRRLVIQHHLNLGASLAAAGLSVVAVAAAG